MVDASLLAQIVLAAGRSERMGRPKPLLALGGKTLLCRVLEAAAGAGVGRSVVVVGPEGGEVEASHEPDSLSMPVLFSTNEVPGSEQLDSLKVGLRALEVDPPAGFFIHPVDCPLARAADYWLLAEAFDEEAEGAGSVLILSHAQRRGHPVLCRWELAAEFLALAPGATARQVIERQPIRYVLTSNPGVLEDVDTPQDYERLKHLLERE